VPRTCVDRCLEWDSAKLVHQPTAHHPIVRTCRVVRVCVCGGACACRYLDWYEILLSLPEALARFVRMMHSFRFSTRLTIPTQRRPRDYGSDSACAVVRVRVCGCACARVRLCVCGGRVRLCVCACAVVRT
jgi:hypothetical protein